MLSNILAVLGLLVGVAGLAFAVYQGSERRRLADYIRSQNWHLYSKANNANGAVQVGISKYKTAHATNLSPDVVETLARADAFGQDVFKDVIRQIQVAEPEFSMRAIDTWVQDGRVSQEHAVLFRNLAPANNSFKPNPLRGSA